jgi:hypothetical protein
MRTEHGTNTVWIRVLLAWSLFLASAGASLAMGASVLQAETQESLGARLRTAAIVVFRSLRPLTRRLGVEFDLATADELAVDSRDVLRQLSGVTGHVAPCEHASGDCAHIAC